MHLLVIRHATAKDRERWARTGQPDEMRPLTRRGRRLMRRSARGLCHLIGKLDALASSPLVRAWETAEIVAAAFGGLDIIEVPTLAPGARPQALAAWIGSPAGAHSTVAIVSHEPGLGDLVSWFLAGSGAFIALRKGGACLLELEGVEPGSAKLLWSLTPRQLRRVA